MVHRRIIRSMSGSLNAHPAPNHNDAQSEIERALRLSASLNNPADHAVVAQYIAELAIGGRRAPREAQQ